MSLPRKTFGQSAIANLKDFIERVKRGDPMRQSNVRRMVVKGKTVYVHSRFTAPVGRIR